MMNTDGELSWLDPKNKDTIDKIAYLHSHYLPNSPIAKLGPLFMKKFYYVHMVEAKLVDCLTYHINNECVGFLAFTRFPTTLMKEGQRMFFGKLCLVMFLSILTRPSILFQIFKVAM